VVPLFSLTRTWHTQLGIFWIATAWLATGLFMAPGRLGLWSQSINGRASTSSSDALLLIVVPAPCSAQWYACACSGSGLVTNFWFGHQGYEYVDLGRFWQMVSASSACSSGSALMVRGPCGPPIIRRATRTGTCCSLFLISSLAPSA
jgi:nitric oxide reductase subunit B